MTRAFTLMVLTVALALSSPVPGRAAAGLRLGFGDGNAELLSGPGGFATVLTHGRDAGASIWRFGLSWSVVAPEKPPSIAAASDPGWSGYDWTTTDRTVETIAAAGLQALPVVTGAAAWAEGPARPPVSATYPAGTWRPSAAWYGAFATALAKRYSGRFPDPASPGATLPAVTTWQAWNEPNLNVDVTPQWTQHGATFTAASPTIYRGLLNAFYAGIKAVAPHDIVVTAGTAPFGDLHPGDPRMPPARFWRELLCVRGRVHPVSTHCAQHVSFDAYAHHPYPIGPPRRHAINADDVVVPDLGKISRVVKVAERAGTVRPAGPKPLWITEISWDSHPDPDGLSLADQATYLEGALYVLWTQGASVVTWFNERDDPPIPSYDTTYQSGIYMDGPTPAQDVPKPSFTAFRFPFTAYRYSGVARLWGMAPAAGGVTVQAHEGGRWVTAARLHAGANRVFTGTLRVGQGTALRAVAGTATSLTWTTF